MRTAPSVVVDLPGSRRWDVACILIGMLGAACGAAALASHLFPDGSLRAGLSIAIAAVCGGLLMWHARPRGRGRLRWDGEQWWFSAQLGEMAAEQAGTLKVMIDGGRWMLVCFISSGKRSPASCIWLPVSDQQVRQSGGLRAAAYAQGVTDIT
jgi:hypothetical protein